MHCVYLGVLRSYGRELMKLVVFKKQNAINVLNERLLSAQDDLPSSCRVPTIRTTKADGVFHFPTGKAAHSRYLFSFYMLSLLENLLPAEHVGLLRMTVTIALAFASNAVYTEDMARRLQALIVRHHQAYADLFGTDSILPNFHMRACVGAWMGWVVTYN